MCLRCGDDSIHVGLTDDEVQEVRTDITLPSSAPPIHMDDINW